MLAACGPTNATWYGDYCLPSMTDCGHPATGIGDRCDGSISIDPDLDGVFTSYVLKTCTVSVSDKLK